MNDNNQLLAKEMFLKYGASHFHMQREGEYEDYKKYKISKEQEDVWTDEYQQELLAKIADEDIVSSSFMQLTSTLRRTRNIKYFTSLLGIVKTMTDRIDTFTELRISEEILLVAENIMNGDDSEKARISLEAKQIAYDILSKSIRMPITIASYYRDLDYLKDVLTEDNIVSRMRKLLKNIKSEEKGIVYFDEKK